MASRADWRTGGLAVGLWVGPMLAAGAVLLSARPPDRQSADIHAEYVKYLSGRDTITAYLAYPERADRAPGVVVIHEIFGMSDFIRQTTEQMAREGFVALAPDLLSRRGGTPASTDSARKLIGGLNPDTVTMDVDATVAYLKTLKAVRRDRIGVIGFCWGGGQSFRYATNRPDLKAAFVFYGTAPTDDESLKRIKAPVYGFYGGNDARIDSTIPATQDAMKKAGKKYDPVTYEGAGHGFMRSGQDPAGKDADKKAHDDAWKRWLDLLRTI